MKAPSTGEGVNRLDDHAAGFGDRSLAGLQVVAIKNDQWLFRGLVRVGLEAAVEAGIVGGGVGRAVVGEGPAEGLAVERLQRSQVGGGEFDIVDVMMVFCHRMSSQTAAGLQTTSSISAIVRTL